MAGETLVAILPKFLIESVMVGVYLLYEEIMFCIGKQAMLNVCVHRK